MDLNCYLEKNQLTENELAFVTCSLKNIGNVYLEHIDVCLKENCKSLGLGISQSADMQFQIDTSSIGKQKIPIIAKNTDISKSTYLEYGVLDKPSIEITSLEYPEEVEFGQDYSIFFILSKKSFSTPKGVRCIL